MVWVVALRVGALPPSPGGAPARETRFALHPWVAPCRWGHTVLRPGKGRPRRGPLRQPRAPGARPHRSEDSAIVGGCHDAVAHRGHLGMCLLWLDADGPSPSRPRRGGGAEGSSGWERSARARAAGSPGSPQARAAAGRRSPGWRRSHPAGWWTSAPRRRRRSGPCAREAAGAAEHEHRVGAYPVGASESRRRAPLIVIQAARAYGVGLLLLLRRQRPPRRATARARRLRSVQRRSGCSRRPRGHEAPADQHQAARTRELDIDLDIDGGDIGAPNPQHPPSSQSNRRRPPPRPEPVAPLS